MSKFIGIVIEGLTDAQEQDICGVVPCVGTNSGLFIPLDDESDIELFKDHKCRSVYI
jgi:hypothetical protein